MISEGAIALAVTEWLSAKGWDVFAEVCLDRHLRERHDLGDARADLVATRQQQIAVVECKRELSFELFSQGQRWNPFADMVWIAVPLAKFTDGRREAFAIAGGFYGFGILEHGDEGIAERVAPRRHRRRDDALVVSLSPEHKTHAAPGTNQGGQWSAFKRTAEALAAFVARPENRGCTLEEALEVTGHHYRSKATALEQLAKQIKRGIVPGVVSGWKQRLYPSGDPHSNRSEAQ